MLCLSLTVVMTLGSQASPGYQPIRLRKWVERAFCSNCGSSLYYRHFDNNKYHVSAGLFNCAELVLSSQIFIDEKPASYDLSNLTKTKTGKAFCNIRHGSDFIEMLDSDLS